MKDTYQFQESVNHAIVHVLLEIKQMQIHALSEVIQDLNIYQELPVLEHALMVLMQMILLMLEKAVIQLLHFELIE